VSRAARLLDLIAALRRHRRPVSGRVLAEALGISLRTLYRDIASLQGQGAPIEGEAGLGYVLRPGYLLPPLMFGEEEVEALALGARWVAGRGDRRLAEAARSALARIAAVLPAERRNGLDAGALLVGPAAGPGEAIDPAALRAAIRGERKLRLDYRDAGGAASERIVWPIALAFFANARVLVAWCELRQDFRHFRTDRIAGLTVLEARPPRRRAVLLGEWREAEGIAAPD
jgi:predicted DNA-binding transcriptional regulator YafY